MINSIGDMMKWIRITGSPLDTMICPN